MNKDDNKIFSKNKITISDFDELLKESELSKLISQGLVTQKIAHNLEFIFVWAHNGEPVKLDDNDIPIEVNAVATIQKWWKKTRKVEVPSLDFSKETCIDLLGKQSYESLLQSLAKKYNLFTSDIAFQEFLMRQNFYSNK